MKARLAIAVIAACLAPLAANAGGEADSGAGAKKGAARTRAAAPAKEKKSTLPTPFLQLPAQKAEREEIEASALPAAIKEKMLAAQPLWLEEIEELGKAELSAPLILKYLRSEGGGYVLLTADIDRLRAAGIGNDALDFLLAAAARRRAFYSYPYLYSSPSFYHHDSFHHDSHFGSFGHHDDHH